MLPERIGPYLIERKVGAGGMGTVYYGKHVETGREAAVKVLPSSLAREGGFVARFTREIEAIEQLTNPHVVKLFDSGLESDPYYYAMEYVEGETVTMRLRRNKRLPWRDVIDIAVQVCSALKAAHDAGIIHRDLKPSNLIIRPDGMVKLMDFGVAQVFAASKLTQTGGIIGTPEYMSPEQAQGKRSNKKSDLYSLGAVMYVMLCGRPPFLGRTTLDIAQKHQYGQFDRPKRIVPEIPVWLDDVVCQLLEKDPDRRPADAYVLSRRLQEIVRKVELSQKDSTLGGDAKLIDGTAPTAVAGHYDGPGSGTLMRDMLKAEVERAQQPTAVGSLFNNIWILVFLLLVLIGGGLFFFRDRFKDPQAQFAAGQKLMEENQPGPAWQTAQHEYFEPLIERDEKTWKPKVQPYLDQIETAERHPPLRFRQLPQSEPERILKQARALVESGQYAEAKAMLDALIDLIEDQPDYQTIYKLAKRDREAIKNKVKSLNGRRAFVTKQLKAAEDFQDEGQLEQARAIWTHLVVLYGNERDLADLVQKARDRLVESSD